MVMDVLLCRGANPGQLGPTNPSSNQSEPEMDSNVNYQLGNGGSKYGISSPETDIRRVSKET